VTVEAIFDAGFCSLDDAATPFETPKQIAVEQPSRSTRSPPGVLVGYPHEPQGIMPQQAAFRYAKRRPSLKNPHPTRLMQA